MQSCWMIWSLHVLFPFLPCELITLKNDHWTSKHHKVVDFHSTTNFRLMRSSQAERNWFIEQVQQFAQQQGIRVTFLSGDVHCAAVGVLKTLQKSKKLSGLAPASDHRYMLNVVTSTYVTQNCHVMLTPTFRCDCQHTVGNFTNAGTSCPYVIAFLILGHQWARSLW
jgi:hypothetical protein